MQTGRIVAFIGQALGLLDWFSYMGGQFVVGGSATSGRISNGHYFLGDKGQLTEVSRQIFLYSQWHHRVAIVGLVLVGLCTAYLFGTRPKGDN